MKNIRLLNSLRFCLTCLLASFLLILSTPTMAMETGANVAGARNLVIVSIDGLRWQEVFRGLDKNLVANEEFTHWQSKLEDAFSVGEGSAAKLMPFFHQVLASQGLLYGNRDQGQCMEVKNDWYFSYPGYNELLTGFADPAIDSNDKKPNPNVTTLEWLNRQSAFAGRVYAFASWDVFPYIINTARSKVPVNAGFMQAAEFFDELSAKEVWFDQLQGQIPSPWDTVRLDAFTHHYAMETLQRRAPRVLYIAYGETDDFAHDGRYDQYAFAAHRSDAFIAELWQTLQSMPAYRGQTNLIVTTDHGRGEVPLETWQHHSSRKALEKMQVDVSQAPNGIEGSNAIWFAAIGPDIQAGVALDKNLQVGNCLGLNQLAATLMATFGYDWRQQQAQAGTALKLK